MIATLTTRSLAAVKLKRRVCLILVFSSLFCYDCEENYLDLRFYLTVLSIFHHGMALYE